MTYKVRQENSSVESSEVYYLLDTKKENSAPCFCFAIHQPFSTNIRAGLRQEDEQAGGHKDEGSYSIGKGIQIEMRKSQLQNYDIIEDTHQIDFPKLSNLFPK